MRAVLLALFVAAPYALPANADEPVRLGACESGCDREAAACVDRCESAHPNDPAARVGCKVKCADARKSCSKSCK